VPRREGEKSRGTLNSAPEPIPARPTAPTRRGAALPAALLADAVKGKKSQKEVSKRVR
jgi:hypothetical protein